MATSSRPSRFIIDTDYRALKRNDIVGTDKEVLGGQVIAAGGKYEWSEDVVAGEPGSLASTLIFSWNNSRGFHHAPGIAFVKTGTVSGSPATYNMTCLITRVSATSFRYIIQIVNPYSSALTTAATDTVSFVICPIVPPYE